MIIFCFSEINLSLLDLYCQESGMTIITAEDLDDAAEKAVKAAYS